MATERWVHSDGCEWVIGPDYRCTCGLSEPTAQFETPEGHVLWEGSPMQRITKKEWQAIGTALGAALADDAEDVFGTELVEAMKSAHVKVSERMPDEDET